MESCTIYALIDPETLEVKYIGKTRGMRARMDQHMNDARIAFKNGKQNPKEQWINSLREKKKKPLIVRILECRYEDADFFERAIFLEYSTKCNLLNKNTTFRSVKQLPIVSHSDTHFKSFNF